MLNMIIRQMARHQQNSHLVPLLIDPRTERVRVSLMFDPKYDFIAQYFDYAGALKAHEPSTYQIMMQALADTVNAHPEHAANMLNAWNAKGCWDFWEYLSPNILRENAKTIAHITQRFTNYHAIWHHVFPYIDPNDQVQILNHALKFKMGVRELAQLFNPLVPEEQYAAIIPILQKYVHEQKDLEYWREELVEMVLFGAPIVNHPLLHRILLEPWSTHSLVPSIHAYVSTKKIKIRNDDTIQLAWIETATPKTLDKSITHVFYNELIQYIQTHPNNTLIGTLPCARWVQDHLTPAHHAHCLTDPINGMLHAYQKSFSQIEPIMPQENQQIWPEDWIDLYNAQKDLVDNRHFRDLALQHTEPLTLLKKWDDAIRRMINTPNARTLQIRKPSLVHPLEYATYIDQGIVAPHTMEALIILRRWIPEATMKTLEDIIAREETISEMLVASNDPMRWKSIIEGFMPHDRRPTINPPEYHLEGMNI